MNRIVAILLALMVIVALLGSGVQATETRAVARPASRHKNKNKWGSHHKNKNKRQRQGRIPPRVSPRDRA